MRLEAIRTLNLDNLDLEMFGLIHDEDLGVSADKGDTWFKQCPDYDLEMLEWDVRLWLKPFKYENLKEALASVLEPKGVYTGKINAMPEKELVEYTENKLALLGADYPSHSWEESMQSILEKEPMEDVEWLQMAIDRWWELNT